MGPQSFTMIFVRGEKEEVLRFMRQSHAPDGTGDAREGTGKYDRSTRMAARKKTPAGVVPLSWNGTAGGGRAEHFAQSMADKFELVACPGDFYKMPGAGAPGPNEKCFFCGHLFFEHETKAQEFVDWYNSPAVREAARVTVQKEQSSAADAEVAALLAEIAELKRQSWWPRVREKEQFLQAESLNWADYSPKTRTSMVEQYREKISDLYNYYRY